MDTTVLLITAVIEILLVTTQLLACWLKLTDRYGGEAEHVRCKWEDVPFNFEVDWYNDNEAGKASLGILQRHSDDEGVELPPKFDDPHSRDV